MGIFSSVTRLLLPILCPGCGEGLSRPGLCGDCRRTIEPIGLFREVRGPPGLCVWGGTAYRGPARSLLYDYKFRRRRDLAETTAEWAIAAVVAARREGEIPPAGTEGWIVVPVPASRRRSAARGFDPVEPIARAVARAAGLPFARGLARVRETPPQSGLALSDRRENLRGVFAPAWGRPPLGVLFVDDVATSGATLVVAAAAARAGRAHRVVAAVAAVVMPGGWRVG